MSQQHAPRVSHWPPALISAALRQGTIVATGPGYRPVSWPDSPHTRCSSIAHLLTPAFAAAELTAAWILGAAHHPGSSLCFTRTRGRVPAFHEAPGASFHEFALEPDDVVWIGRFAVTSPSRTAYDLLRSSLPLTQPRQDAIRKLVRLGEFSRDQVVERTARTTHAHRTRVLARMESLCLP